MVNIQKVMFMKGYNGKKQVLFFDQTMIKWIWNLIQNTIYQNNIFAENFLFIIVDFNLNRMNNTTNQ